MSAAESRMAQLTPDRPAALRAGRRNTEFPCAEKGKPMFCNSCNNNGLWIIILIIILFGCGGNGFGCGCDNNNGCGCGC